MSTGTEASAYALLADGTTIEIRPARPGDFDAVRDMNAKMSPDNLYLRFFSFSAVAAEREAHRVCREPAPDHVPCWPCWTGKWSAAAATSVLTTAPDPPRSPWRSPTRCTAEASARCCWST